MIDQMIVYAIKLVSPIFLVHRDVVPARGVNELRACRSHPSGLFGPGDSTYRKVPVVGKLDFEFYRVPSKNMSKYGPKVDFKISHSLESSILTLQAA